MYSVDPMRYDSKVATSWMPNVKAPNLSNVLQLAGQAGRDEAMNSILGEMIKAREAALKASQEERKEKEAAKEDLGNEPESEGFWQKLGDWAGEGLSRTIDVISRFNYASANAAMEMSKKDVEQEKEHVNFWENLTGEVGHLPETLKAGWQGFTGKEKTTFGQVIDYRGSANPKKTIADNGWMQGIGGFFLDVVMDPTTYIGVGLIAKPFKTGSKAAEEAVGTHAKDLYEFSKEAEKFGVKLPGDSANLTRGQIYDALGGPRLNKTKQKGRANKRQAARVAGTKAYVDNYELIRNSIKDSGGKLPEPSIANRAGELEVELGHLKQQYDNALQSYGQRAYKDALQRYAKLNEKNIPAAVGTAAEAASKTTKTWTESLDIARIATAISKTNQWSKGRKAELLKPLPDGEDFAKSSVYSQFLKEREEFFDNELNGAWLSDPRISPEFRAKALEELETLSKSTPKVREIKDLLYGNLYKQKGFYEKQLKDARSRKDWDAVRNIQSQLTKIAGRKGDPSKGIEPIVGKIGHTFNDLNATEAKILFRMIGRETRDPRFAGSPNLARLDEIEGEITEVKALLNQSTSRDHPSLALDQATDQQIKNAERTLRDLNKEKADILNSDDFITKGDSLEVPEGMPKESSAYVVLEADGSLSMNPGVPQEAQEFAEQVLREVDLRTERNLHQKIRTYTRRARERREAANPEGLTDEMLAKSTPKAPTGPGGIKVLPFGGPTKKIPQILIDGKAVLKNDKYLDSILGKNVTEADWKKSGDAWKAGNKPTDQAQVDLSPVKADEVIDPDDIIDDVLETGERAKKRGPATQTPAHYAFDRLFEKQFGTSVGAAAKARGTAATFKENPKDWSPKIPEADLVKMRKDSAELAMKWVDRDLVDGKLEGVLNESLDLQGLKTVSVNDVAENVDNIADVHRIAVKETKEQYARRIAAEKMAKPRGNSNAAKAKDRIRQLEEAMVFEVKMLDEAMAEATKTSDEMLKRMDEQVTLNMLADATMTGKSYFEVTFAGLHAVDIPVPVAMTRATEKIGGLPILQAANKAWSQAFHPASKLEPEMNLARLRAQSRTPDIIKHHVDDIRNKFAKFKPAQRKAALRGIIKGAPVEGQLSDDMAKFFDDFLPYVQGQVSIGDEILEIRELNRFLPENFQLVHPTGGNTNAIQVMTPRDLLSVMRNVEDVDPMQVMWRLKIASEQALANKAMIQTIRSTFGVQRIIRDPSDRIGQLAPRSIKEDLIEDLKTKHGWVQVRDMGDNYYFPPEMATQIDRLMEIIKPAKIHEVTRLFDKVLRFWKSTVTVYNPGYYSRNGIGESIMGMMDGVMDPKHYSRSASILRHAMPDDVNEALKTLEPWKRHETTRQAMARKVVRTKGGVELTGEDVWVLYHEMGLKSGFISTEFDHYFPTAGSMKANPVGQFATKINDKVRMGGEKYEDYFRLAHFISRLERSEVRSLSQIRKAAELSAEKVRKFHYDYTDFTPFEKSVMMRTIPFYKWTRKSLPLMASMLFTRPGLVALYPKAMQNLSYATGGTDPAMDENGFVPNYEALTPNWMQNLMAYPIGADEEEAMTYMNVATPQFDIYKMMQNPVSATIGMMNPMFKVPLEQGMGQTMDPDFNMQLDSPQARWDHLMRTTPATSLISKLQKGSAEGEDSAFTEPGLSPLDERLTSFLTGLGFYENDKKRQQGEQLRRNLAGE